MTVPSHFKESTDEYGRFDTLGHGGRVVHKVVMVLVQRCSNKFYSGSFTESPTEGPETVLVAEAVAGLVGSLTSIVLLTKATSKAVSSVRKSSSGSP